MDTTRRRGSTDAAIQQSVLRELHWDTRVDETAIGVEVSEGIVTLRGVVGSWAERVAAQDAAHRVPDVQDVANDIEVRLPGAPGRTDTDIARSVRHALEWDVFVPEEHVRTTVTNGEVTLEGHVDTFREAQAAERAVRDLVGVRAVVNRIDVRPEIVPDDLRDAIEDALERQAIREARRVGITIKDGHVTVSGPARSWAEREAIIGVIKGTRGVRAVHDNLHIEG
jgi:hyperosmotically inducible protein